MNRFAFMLALLGLAALPVRAEWTAIGPDGGRLQALAADPSHDSTLYALCLEDVLFPRLFRTTDAGQNWSNIARMPDSLLTSIAVDPHDARVIYACGRESRICRSTDSGFTWNRIELSGFASMVMPDPLVRGRVFVAGYCRFSTMQPVVFISDDFGQNWQMLSVDSAEGHAMCGDVDPNNAGVIYVGGTNARLYRSTDAGRSWQLCNSTLPPTATVQTISVNHANPSLLLAATTGGLYRSTDVGASWALVQTETQAWKAGFSPVDAAVAYAIGYDFVARFCVSTDGGVSWTTPPPGTYVGRTDGLLVGPGPTDAAWLYTNGGARRTLDRGAHWSWVNSGMKIARVLALTNAPQDSSWLFLSTSDNGIYRSRSGGSDWDRCAEFTGCGNIGAISAGPGGPSGVVYALEGSG